MKLRIYEMCRLESLLKVALLILKLFVLRGGLLVLLVLGHQIVHVGLGLSELHLVHALAGVPMEESLPPEHGGELLRDPLEDLLDGGGVTDEGGGHGKASGGNITYSNLINNRFIKKILLWDSDIQFFLTLTLFGIHSTKYDEFLFCTANICSSTSFIDILPRNIAATARGNSIRKL